MASLFFICPKTRHKAPTGIETDAKSLQAAWTGIMKVDCPHCHEAHDISVRDTYIEVVAQEIPIGCIGSDDAAGSTAGLRRIESRASSGGARTAGHAAGGRLPPLAAVRPRLLRTGKGERAGGIGSRLIDLGRERGDLRRRLIGFGNGRRPVGILLGRGAGKRRHHRGAERQRHGAGYDPGN